MEAKTKKGIIVVAAIAVVLGFMYFRKRKEGIASDEQPTEPSITPKPNVPVTPKPNAPAIPKPTAPAPIVTANAKDVGIWTRVGVNYQPLRKTTSVGEKLGEFIGYRTIKMPNTTNAIAYVAFKDRLNGGKESYIRKDLTNFKNK